MTNPQRDSSPKKSNGVPMSNAAPSGRPGPKGCTTVLLCNPHPSVDSLKSTDGLSDLLQSLVNQYDLWFDKTAFFKMFEDARGTNWKCPFPCRRLYNRRRSALSVSRAERGRLSREREGAA